MNMALPLPPRPRFPHTTMARFILHYFIILSAMCSLVSINAHGLRSSDRRQTAFHYFKRHKHDIILLQETHWTHDIIDLIQREWNGMIFCSHGSATAKGVAILINPHSDYNVTQINSDHDGRIININISIDDHHLNIVNIYAPSTNTERQHFYSSIPTYLSPTQANILGGDFNSISDPK